MKDEPAFADEPKKGVLFRKGDKYNFLGKSRFETTLSEYKGNPDYEGNVILSEKILDDKTYSFSLKASPSLSTDPEIYLKALTNIFDNKYIELSNPKENIDLGISSETQVKTGAVGFSGNYNNQHVKGTIGADVNISRDLVRVDIKYTDKNKKLLSSIRKALLGINPEIDGSSDITHIVDVSGRKGMPQEKYVKREVIIV